MKNNFTHLENLINVAEENQVEEYLFYRDRGRNLTAKQLELILLKSGIQPPEDLTPKISKKELKKLYITNLLQAGTVVSTLFEELKYDLKEIRNGKPVKPVFFTQLPRGINELDSISQRKQVFIQVVLPLVLSENEKILLVRKKIKFLANSNSISTADKKWLDKKFKQYRVKNNNIKNLLE